MNKILKIFTIFLFFILSLLSVAWVFLGPVGGSDETQIFVVPQEKRDFDIVKALHEQNLIRNEKAFQFLVDFFGQWKGVESGGYRLSKKMNAWQILAKLNSKQDLFWVEISFCPRKEQVGEKLAKILGWSKEKLERWNNIYKDNNLEFFEGVYYPDTYLIPADESEDLVVQRFINRFNEKFAPLADKFLKKNIRWTTGLKIASLIAREAAGSEDMKLISGVIWNRLNEGMRLQIDATMQYTLGKNENGSWWGNIDLEEKQKDSPYNSYLHEGLPPTPICSPGIEAVEAALNPEETDCLYYLHDKNKQIHCAETYKGHQENIEKYL